MQQNIANIAEVIIEGPLDNRLNPEVTAALTQALLGAEADPAVTGIVVTGAGDSFCGGLDVDGIRAGGDPVEFARSLADLLRIFPTLTKPVAAAINGDALASGAAIVAACDYAVISPDLAVGTFEVGVNAWPTVAQVPLVKRIGARAAMENIGSGDPFTAQRALEVGLVNAVVPANEVRAAAEAWLTRAARGAAAFAARPFLYEIEELSYDEALDRSLDKFVAQHRAK